MTLAEYIAEVRRLAKEKDRQRIFNGSFMHASAIVQVMLENGENQIDILSNRLDSEVYGRPEVLSEAATFLVGKKGKIRVLIEEETSLETLAQNNTFFSVCKNTEGFEIRQVAKFVQDQYTYNFLVRDGIDSRFESDRDKCSAVAVFKDKNQAEHLEDIFNSMWKDFSEEIPMH